MLIAQALGEYGVMSALMEGLQSGGIYLEEQWRESGLAWLAVLVAFTVIWKILTRVK